MPEQTDYFGLNKYHPGETDWTHDDLVDAVDEEALRYGLLSDRPDAAAVPDGRRYLDEHGRIARAEGSDWVRDPVGSQEKPVPAIHTETITTQNSSTNIAVCTVTHLAYQEEGETKIVARDGEVLESEGFAGDAFRLFIEAMGDEPFHLHISEGEYTVDWSDIRIQHDNQWVSGTAMGVTVIKLKDGAESVDKGGVIEIRATSGDWTRNNGIMDLTVHNNRDNFGDEPSANLEPVQIEYAEDWYVGRVESLNGIDDAFDIDNAESGLIEACRATDFRNDGFHMSADAHDNMVIGCRGVDENNYGRTFTQQNGASGNIYVGCYGEAPNHGNFDITAESGGGDAVVVGCRSVGRTSEDNFSGADYAQVNGSVFGAGGESASADILQLSSNQPIIGGEYTTIGFDTWDHEGIGGWNTSEHLFTAPAEGVYQINCHVSLDDTESGDELRLRSRVGGSSKELVTEHGTGSFSTSVDLSAAHYLSEGETIELEVRNNARDDTIRSGGGGGATRLSIVQL